MIISVLFRHDYHSSNVSETKAPLIWRRVERYFDDILSDVSVKAKASFFLGLS